MSRGKSRRARMSAAAQEFVGDARHRAEQAYERAEEAFEHAHELLEDGLDDAHSYVKRQWRERPLAVAATAAGVGLLIGLLIAGSTSRR